MFFNNPFFAKGVPTARISGGEPRSGEAVRCMRWLGVTFITTAFRVFKCTHGNDG